MEILPPILQQEQFWYKTNNSDHTLPVIQIMEVTAEEYHYREWRPTEQDMRHAVGRKVEWTAPSIEVQSRGGVPKGNTPYATSRTECLWAHAMVSVRIDGVAPYMEHTAVFLQRYQHQRPRQQWKTR